MRLARRRSVHALPVQRYHTLWRVAQGQVTEAQLPAVVAAPGVDLAVAPDGDDVRGVAARRHEGKAHPAEPHQPVRALQVGQLVGIEGQTDLLAHLGVVGCAEDDEGTALRRLNGGNRQRGHHGGCGRSSGGGATISSGGSGGGSFRGGLHLGVETLGAARSRWLRGRLLRSIASRASARHECTIAGHVSSRERDAEGAEKSAGRSDDGYMT